MLTPSYLYRFLYMIKCFELYETHPYFLNQLKNFMKKRLKMKNENDVNNNHKQNKKESNPSFKKNICITIILIFSFMIILFYFTSQMVKSKDTAFPMNIKNNFKLPCCKVVDGVKNHTKNILSYGTRLPGCHNNLKIRITWII
jgi:hypothetical protein